MEVFKYLFKLFNSKDALIKQVSLFALVGIMVIFFNNYASNWTNMLFDNFYINPPTKKIYMQLSFGMFLFILIYLVGYRYKFLGQIAEGDRIVLPQISLQPFKVFVKLLPLFLAWGFYYFVVISVVCFVLFNYQNMASYYVFYSIMLCLLPFVFIIFTEFASTLQYKKKYFNPLYLIKVLDKTLGDVILLSIEILIPATIVGYIIYAWFLYASNIKSEMWLFGVRYFGICLSVYLLLILKYVYFTGLAKIAYKKFNRE